MNKTLYVITDQLFMHRVIKNNPVTIMLKHAKAVCCWRMWLWRIQCANNIVSSVCTCMVKVIFVQLYNFLLKVTTSFVDTVYFTLTMHSC